MNWIILFESYGRFFLIGRVLLGMHLSIMSKKVFSQFAHDALISPSMMTSTRTRGITVATPIPPTRSRFELGLQLGQGIQNCQFGSVAQQTGIGSGLPSLQLPLPSTTSDSGTIPSSFWLCFDNNRTSSYLQLA